VPPHPVLVLAASAACFYATGDGLCTWALGLRPSWHPARILLAIGAGVLLLLVLAASLYIWGAAPTAAALSPWLPLALAATSAAGWWRARARAPAPPALPPWILAPFLAAAALGAGLVLWPTLGGGGGFYYSNNGEFSNYAAITDFVLRNPIDARSDLIVPLRSREGAIAVLCAEVAALLRVPPLFVVQPLSALFAAMLFGGVALWLATHATRAGARPAGVALAAVLLAGFVASPSSQRFWTLPFLSQFLALALLGAALGWLPWAELPAATPRGKIVAAGAVGGVLVSGWLTAYPEMAPLVIGFGFLFALPRWGLEPRALPLAAAVAAAVTTSAGALGFGFFLDRLGLRTRLTNGTEDLAVGWDLFGAPEKPLRLATNQLGFTSIAPWGPEEPGLLPIVALVAFGALVAGAIAWGAMRAKDRRDAGVWAAAASVAFLAISACLFVWVRLDPSRTTYIAVKFASGFLWVPVLATAAWVATAPRGPLAAAAAAIGIIVAAQATGAVAFERGIAADAEATRLHPWDLGIGARLIPPGDSVFLAEPVSRRLHDGAPVVIATYRLDLLFVWKGRIEPDAEGLVLSPPPRPWKGERWVIAPAIREGGQTIRTEVPPAYAPAVERPGYTIYRLR
jgi:hypothetical protein